MITVLSPAKKLSKECSALDLKKSECDFLDESLSLAKVLKGFESEDLQKLMGISKKLSQLNVERFQKWSLPFKDSSARQAIFSFMGDTYTGVDASTLSLEDIKFAQENIRILSGLYGLLRPMDLIMPYRLEMGTKLKTDRGNHLHDFWKSLITKALDDELENHKNDIIVNCASVEYFNAIDTASLRAKVVTPLFKEYRDGKPKIISFFAKRARGSMARYIVNNRISDIDGILSFDYDGYSYNSQLSKEFEPVFTRKSQK